MSCLKASRARGGHRLTYMYAERGTLCQPEHRPVHPPSAVTFSVIQHGQSHIGRRKSALRNTSRICSK